MPKARLERRWLILAFAMIYIAVTYGLVGGGFTFWVAPWGHDFKVPRSLIMTVYSVATLAMVLVAPLIGRGLDFLSVRGMFAIGAIMLAAGMALASLAPTFWLLLAVFATVIPIGAAFAGTLPATALVVRLFPGSTGLVNGLMSLGMALSAVVVAVAFAPLIGVIGWRGTFLVAAVVVVGVILPIGWFLMNVEAGAPVRAMKPETSSEHVSAEGFAGLKQPIFWVLVLATLPIILTLAAVPPNLAAIATDSGVDPAHAALLVSALAIGAAFGCLGGGWLADRLPPRMMYAGIFFATVAVMLIMASRPNWMVMVLAMGTLGLAGGSMMPWTAAMIMRIFGAQGFARAIGLISPFFIPATFAPILFGAIRDLTGGNQAAFLVFAALLAPGGVCLVLLKPAVKEPVLAPAE